MTNTNTEPTYYAIAKFTKLIDPKTGEDCGEVRTLVKHQLPLELPNLYTTKDADTLRQIHAGLSINAHYYEPTTRYEIVPQAEEG